MKYVGQHVIRGKTTEALFVRHRLDQGNYKFGYRVTHFYVKGEQYNEVGVIGKLSYTDDVSNTVDFYNFENSQEFGWAGMDSGTDIWQMPPAFIIDPTNMIVDEFYVCCRSNANEPISYMIVMDKYEMEDDEGTINKVARM